MDIQLNLKSPWSEVKERLKEHNIGLTDEDLEFTPGQEEALLGRLQQKLQKTPQQLKEYIESVSANTSKAG